MATIKIILGFFCLIAFGSGWNTERGVVEASSRGKANSSSRMNVRDPLFMHSSEDVSYDRHDGVLYEKIVAAAQKSIGIHESSIPNTGTEVSAYLRYCGINTPAPWCAAWVSGVFRQAGYKAPKTAWSPALFPAPRQVAQAAPGIVLGIYYAALKRIGHCGIVERVSGDWVFSIEGNTGGLNERDGDGVWRKRRHKRSIHRYADWVKGGLQ